MQQDQIANCLGWGLLNAQHLNARLSLKEAPRFREGAVGEIPRPKIAGNGSQVAIAEEWLERAHELEGSQTGAAQLL